MMEQCLERKLTFVAVNEKIAESIVGSYKSIEEGMVGNYKKTEAKAVVGFHKYIKKNNVTIDITS